jgi:hypothetical protein
MEDEPWQMAGGAAPMEDEPWMGMAGSG